MQFEDQCSPPFFSTLGCAILPARPITSSAARLSQLRASTRASLLSLVWARPSQMSRNYHQGNNENKVAVRQMDVATAQRWGGGSTDLGSLFPENGSEGFDVGLGEGRVLGTEEKR